MGGKWNQAGLIKRDGSTAASELILALDWHVMPSDVQLFTTSNTGEDATCMAVSDMGNGCIVRDGICFGNTMPEFCMMCIAEGQAEEACQDVPNENDRKNCVFDIKTTGDIDTWVNAPFYSPDPIDPPDDDRCSDVGDKCKNERGTCVFECVETDNDRCLLGLCSRGNNDDKEGTCYCKISTSEDPSGYAVFIDWVSNLLGVRK
jgi:hypothetical protein